MVNPSFDFFPYSKVNCSKSKEPRPDPVPPPKAWKTRNPCKPVQFSANFRSRSRQRSTMSLPTAAGGGAKSTPGSEDKRVGGGGGQRGALTGVVAAGEVVGGVFLAGEELLGVEEAAVVARSDLVDHGGLEVNEEGPRDVLSGAGLAEEGVEGVPCDSHRPIAAATRDLNQTQTLERECLRLDLLEIAFPNPKNPV